MEKQSGMGLSAVFKSQATHIRPQPPSPLPSCVTLGKLHPAQFLHLLNGGDSGGYLIGFLQE